MQVRVGLLTAPHISYERYERTFLIRNVRIGIGFHWDRTEDQEFAGTLDILHNADGTETAVNTIDTEEYISSVISSEMSADSPIELLKAHAVISRSWLMRAIGHTGHVGYDVCADDHCQRYEGLRRLKTRAVEAVMATQGQVLGYTADGRTTICDCRYHKCCGGKTELFSTCWEDKDYPYLQSVKCDACAEATPTLLRRLLTDFDQETRDFHDWQVSYTNAELQAILREKTGVDFGQITDLVPIKRGPSGRIYELQVVGSRATQTLGKELAIRRALSRSCLYSSWFDIQHTGTDGSEFTLLGHGWGHGVGLCQIGAAVMATQGQDYMSILAHYYPGSRIMNSDQLPKDN